MTKYFTIIMLLLIIIRLGDSSFSLFSFSIDHITEYFTQF